MSRVGSWQRRPGVEKPPSTTSTMPKMNSGTTTPGSNISRVCFPFQNFHPFSIDLASHCIPNLTCGSHKNTMLLLDPMSWLAGILPYLTQLPSDVYNPDKEGIVDFCQLFRYRYTSWKPKQENFGSLNSINVITFQRSRGSV